VKRETRANVIFIVVLLALTLPGGVILFKKKLDPAAPPNYLPDPMRTRLPYVSPMDAPELARYIPELTGKWVKDIAAERGYAQIAMADGLPIMSLHRVIQWMGFKPANKGDEAALLVWDDGVKDADEVVVSAGSNGNLVQIKDFERIIIPEPVRKELVYAGFSKPPKLAAWITIILPNTVNQMVAGNLHVKISGVEETVPYFTK
jgi:hypothetical protein